MIFTDAPICVYVHGGYWLRRDLHYKHGYVALPLHPAGSKYIAVEYDVCPNFTVEEINQQICKAAKFIHNYAERFGSR